MINKTGRKNLLLHTDAIRPPLAQAPRAARMDILSNGPSSSHRIHIHFTETTFSPRIRTGNPAPR